MNFVGHRDQGSNFDLADNLVRILECALDWTGATAVAGNDIGMRFVQDVCIRSLLANPPQQLEIRDEAAAASLNGTVVLDLSGHEHVAPLTGDSFEYHAAQLIFAK